MASVRDAPAAWRLRRTLAPALREPLVQFLAIALVLFGANQLIHGGEAREPADLITISEGRVQQIADSYHLLAGRLPSRTELQALVTDFADEEIAYREAVAMGLDVDDTVVRRRMRQKLEFLAEDAEASVEPTDAQLGTWLREQAPTYRAPERVSFRHVMMSRDTRGEGAIGALHAVLVQLRSGADPQRLGDPSMLPSALTSTTQQDVASLFGEAFAAEVFAHTTTGWFGPVISPLGVHAVLIIAREPPHDPQLKEIRHQLRSDWIEARRKAKHEAFVARLREGYRVAVEWPDGYASPSHPIEMANRARPVESIDASRK